MKMQFYKLKIIFLLSLTMSVVCYNKAIAIELENQTISYSVTYKGYDAGKLEVVIENDGVMIKTRAISHLSNLAKLFLPDQIVQNWFRIDGDSVLLERGHTLARDETIITGSFVIDRLNGKIDFSSNQSEPIIVDDRFEAASFPVVLVTTEISKLNGQAIREISTQKSSPYVYRTPVEESLELKGKVYPVWKVARHQQGNENRYVIFWLSYEYPHIPLKIISSKKENKTVMTRLNFS